MRMLKTASGQARPAGAGPAAPEGGGPAELTGARARDAVAARGRLMIGALRRHWLISALLLAGLVLRLLSSIAYRPALLYIDTLKYLYNAWPGTDPLGYSGVLKAILLVGNLETVAAVQHLVGLAMGMAIYTLLLRRGAARWLAAVAAAPVLLDAYELQIEQTIMPDVWFEALIVAGLVLLLWHPRLPAWAIAAAGITLGLSATVWQGGEVLILPAAVYVLIAVKGAGKAGGGWLRAIGGAALMCAAFALPIVGYMSVSYAVTGHFWLSRSGTSAIYGRVAEAADCATLKLPADERPLCPTARQKALGPDGLEHAPSSPLNTYVAPLGASEPGLVSAYTRAVITQQPWRVLSAYAADVVRLFAVHRATSPGDTPISRWQFQTSYPMYENYVRVSPQDVIIVGLKLQNTAAMNYVTYERLAPSLGGKATVIRPLAAFLRSYQRSGGYTPGPGYLVAAVVGLLGTLSLIRRAGRAKRADRDLALACCLFLITAVVILLASDVPEFSWRYQLPAIVTLPPAGALGLAVILAQVRSRGSRRPAADSPVGLAVAPAAPGPAAPAR
ncbi:MAG TPA: hypothetical protein VH307_14080 [Streptosporangiaceae bacterium]|nr:hypothetical protein [Streptosporangiaceae bacterium]